MDRAVVELAARQHGVVARAQLIELGLSESNIEYRLQAGRLTARSRGVYALGVLQSKFAHWMAAVLAGGPDAVLSHRSAAELWSLLDGFTGPIHVTVPTVRRPRPGVRFHRGVLPSDERTTVEGIPVTTVPRTIFDCPVTMSERGVERLINEADALRLYDRLSLHDLLHRYPGRSGSRKVSKALGKRNAGASKTRSDLEELFIPLVDELDLRRPEFGVELEIDGEKFEIDALWRAERIAVELDSRQFHHTPLAFERDRRRDRKLTAAGWRPVRLTWRHLTEERAAVGSDLIRMHGAAEQAA